MKHYLAIQFSLFRIALGLYLFSLFILSIPFARDLYSFSGIYPLGLTEGVYFPNLFHIIKTTLVVQIALAAGALASILFAAGVYRRLIAVWLWYLWTSILTWVPIINIPHEPYIGWLLLATIFVPFGEPYQAGRENNPRWQMPKIVYGGAWLLLGASYTISGLDKLYSLSWREGEAFRLSLEVVSTKSYFLTIFLHQLPTVLSQFFTWGIILLQLGAIVYILFRPARKIFWVFSLLFHVMILLTVNIPSIAIGMILFHIFIFESKQYPKIHVWLEALQRRLS